MIIADLAYEWEAVFIVECLVEVEFANGITDGRVVVTLQSSMSVN